MVVTCSLKLAQEAGMETTSRLVAALVNEGLVDVTAEHLENTNNVSNLILRQPKSQGSSSVRIKISLRRGTSYMLLPPTEPEEHTVIMPGLDPADVVGPVVIEDLTASNAPRRLEHRPGKVFDVVAPWICTDQNMAVQLRGELENSADNQEKWFKYERSKAPPKLGSPLIEWEQYCIRGHPSHPMHRSFYANPPMNHSIDDIEDFLMARVIMISVPRNRVHLDGPFEESIAPLLQRLKISTTAIPADRVLLPCFAAQLPAIHQYFGTDAVPVGSSELCGMRQASMRTISIPDFPFHVKMALSFTITSARRTMTPWTARMCIETSQLLEAIADPELLWIAHKTAAACSAQSDYESAKHLSVMLRADPEPRARELGQCLVLPVALFEVDSHRRRVPRVLELFNLETTLEARREWFRNYARVYLHAVLPPLLSHGVCMEAHMQNLLARFDAGTRVLRGFVYRDMGGLRMHVPTLAARGVRLRSASLVPGAVTLTDDLEAVWVNAYHNLENHLGGALRALGLGWEDGAGWDVVREELTAALRASADPDGKAEEMLAFMLQPTMKRKAFLRMKIAGIYRGRVYCHLPNSLALQGKREDHALEDEHAMHDKGIGCRILSSGNKPLNRTDLANTVISS
ncbi:IucC family-domain-containing protein [Madurella fahalii]|uniref:IucC family-domain-containing protein n=1 Tax=Madurella fahalii TaxID=1157608 RepID=A0ABQ0G5I0_9PEZI